MKVLFASIPDSRTQVDGLARYSQDLIAALEGLAGVELLHWHPSQPRVAIDLATRLRVIRNWLSKSSKLTTIHRSSLVQELDEEARNRRADIILFNHLLTAWMAIHTSSTIPKIYVAHNPEYLSARSSVRYEQGLRRVTEAFEASGRTSLERQVLSTVNGLTALSHLDAERLGRLSSHAARLPTAVVPPSFEPVAPCERVDTNTALLLGSYVWTVKQANARWVASKVFPMVRRRLPDARLLIAGHRADLLSNLASIPGVELMSNPPDVRPLWTRSAVCVVPERQLGGVKLKVIEAVSQGVPVVSTRAGVEGTHLVDGRSCLVADDPKRFADHIIGVMTSRQRASTIANNATMDMRTYPSTDEKRRRLTELFDRVVRG